MSTIYASCLPSGYIQKWTRASSHIECDLGALSTHSVKPDTVTIRGICKTSVWPLYSLSPGVVVCLLPKFTIQHIFVVIVILFCISNYQIHCFKICGDVFRANKGSEYVPKYMYSCSELKFIEKQFKKLFSTIWKASGQRANTEAFIFNVFFYELLQDIILNIENLF